MSEQAKNDHNIQIVGDFNSRIGQGTDEREENYINQKVRQSQDGLPNRGGEKLLDLCRRNYLIIKNGRTDGDRIGRFTFIGKQGSSVIDYVIENENKNDSLVKNMKILEMR